MNAGRNADIRVLVVEDDPVAADAHQLYVGRVAGFGVAGVAHSRAEAARVLERTPVDLILLDLYLPDGHGLQLRAACGPSVTRRTSSPSPRRAISPWCARGSRWASSSTS